MMWKFLLTFFFVLLFIGIVSANSEFLIYLDDSGNAEFFGSADSSEGFPEDIILLDGRISGTTGALTSKIRDTWTFSFSYPGSDIEIVLPENSRVLDSSGEIYLGNPNILGERLIRSYSRDYIEIRYEVENDGESGSLVIALIVLATIMSVVYWYIRTRKKVEGEKKKEILEKVLNDRERKIVEELRLLGKVKSNALARSTGIPKSSFFRHLHELEKKKIIRLSGDGKNKFVELI